MAFKKKTYHKEENCLNCNYPLVGQYCGHCGQKAFLHKDSFDHMALHFIGDYFHYDSKFWLTIKTLIRKPGLATIEFIQGKRVKYLNPIQLYIFVTTVFFLTVYSFTYIKQEEPKLNKIERERILNEVADSLKKDTQIDIGLSNTDNSTKIGLGQWTPKEKSLDEYDSVQHSLPSNLQDGFIKNKLIRKTLKLEESGHVGDNLGKILIKNIPKVFFILLPFFALLLELIFFRKKYFYVDHIIFSIHFHSFGFIIGLLFLIICQIPFINEYSGLLILLFALSLTIYLALSLKKVYPSPWWKIILKQIVLFLAYFSCFIFLMALVSIYTYFTL
jgi:hypothetical protein